MHPYSHRKEKGIKNQRLTNVLKLYLISLANAEV